MPYEATQRFGLPVQAVCENCSGTYTYKHPMNISMKAGSRDDAVQLVGDAAFEAIRIRRDMIADGDFDQAGWWLWRDGLGYAACPRCGYTQSWQVKVHQAQRVRYVATAIGVLGGAGIFLAVLLNPDYLGNDTLIKLIVGFFAAVVAGPVIFAGAGLILLPIVMLLFKPNRRFQPVITVNKPVMLIAPAAITPAAKKY